MFNNNYEINYSENDMSGLLKPHVLLDFMSDVATKNADVLHFGYADITPKNYGWFLLKYAVEFTKYPQNLRKINVGTNPRGSNKIFTYRDFEIKTINGELLGKAASVWTLIDLKNKKMINAMDVFPETISQYVKQADDLQFEKIPVISNISAEKNYEAGYYDIDINHHVNNATYMLWALDTIPVDFLKQKQIKRIDIAFKKELKFGNTAVSQVEIKDTTTIHAIKNASNQEDLCALKIEWI